MALRYRRTIPTAAALLLAAACGGSEGGPGLAEPDVPAEPSADQVVVSRWLDLDLNGPPNYSDPAWPAHYDELVRARDNAPSYNPVTDEGASLGRVLFYDRALSLNRTTSCASCHVQELGFTDPRRFSIGFDGGETAAHSMRLANANFYVGRDTFWDRRTANLEEQALLPVLDPVELGFSPEAGGEGALIARLEGLEYYPVLFEWAFGSPEITRARIEFALAQFVRSMVSLGSDFDEAFAAAVRTTPPGAPVRSLPDLGPEANLGFRLFLDPADRGGGGCASCHQLPTFALDANTSNNGLDPDEVRVFKTPSLKNVAVTGPYMHDGRFETLEEVVEHYVSGVVQNPALDPRLRAGPGGTLGRDLDLTDAEKAALVAFMRTLTDDAFLRDPKFSDPFRN